MGMLKEQDSQALVSDRPADSTPVRREGLAWEIQS